MWFRMKIIIMLILFILLIVSHIISRKKHLRIVESKIIKFLKSKGYKEISTNNKIRTNNVLIGVLIEASVKDSNNGGHKIICRYNPFRSPKIIEDRTIKYS